MFQNIKADVIYYKTNTDFEMEFNLCGCCRMRLLNSKADDRKSLIADLTRAVQRSRVIIVVGNLFGEDNIIENIAGAISKKISPADNKAYGIKSDEEINIISGSTPLVSEDGFFGGCIIESGPQTMVLLTESRSIKKSIMKNLIHPYLEELYAGELKSETGEEEIAEETGEEIDEKIEIAEEVVDDTALEEEIIDDTPLIEDPELILDDTDEDLEENIIIKNDDEVFNGMIFEESLDEEELVIPEENIELFAEPSNINKWEAMKISESYFAMGVDDLGLIEEEDDPYFIPTKPPIINLPMMVLMVIILVLVAVLCYSLIYIPMRNGIPASDYINNIIETLFV
ncbi:MAG: hypothetical protein IKT38_01025 [Clostridia bacterium]|nr:hypothetical protein [Clostridia bacterium]